MPIFVRNSTTNTGADYSARLYNSQTASTIPDTVPDKSQGGAMLSAGKTVSGEVIAKDGRQITIKLSDDRTLSARLSGDADINIGQKLSFEVGKSLSNQTVLRPLYANMSTNLAVNAALTQAGLPINDRTIAYTSQMMKEGMAISRNALLDMAKSVNTFAEADPVAIVQMKKIGMPLTQSNVSQFENYAHFEHQIVGDAKTIADGLGDIIKGGFELDAENDIYKAINLTNEILDLIDTEALDVLEYTQEPIVMSDAAELIDENGNVINQLTDTGDVVDNANASVNGAVIEELSINGDVEGLAAGIEGADTQEASVVINNNISLSQDEQVALFNDINEILEMMGEEATLTDPLDARQVIDTFRNIINDYAKEHYDGNVSELGMPEYEEVMEAGKNAMQPSSTGNTSIFSRINAFLSSSSSGNIEQEAEAEEDREEIKEPDLLREKISNLAKSEGMTKLIKDSVKAQFVMKPSDITSQEKVQQLYDRILKQSSKINDFMNSISGTESSVVKASTNMTENVQFMDRLNEFVNYIQLPLKMAGQEAHGELYVYTKKRNLSNNDGNFSALLHLDMDHLGPMDVYVGMQNYTKVNTHFYLQTEELLDFINSHVSELTERISKLGYDIKTDVTYKDGNSIKTPITDEFVKDEPGETHSPFSKICFDVRA